MAPTWEAERAGPDLVRLRRYLMTLAVSAIAFGCLGLGIGLGTGDVALRDIGVIVLVYSVLFLASRFAVHGGNIGAIIWVQCVGMWVAAPLLVVAWPGLVPVLTLIPLFALGFALPFFNVQKLSVAIVLSWTSTLATAALGLVVPDRSTAPAAFASGLIVVGAGLAAGIVLVVLWQAFERQREALNSLTVANRDLVLSTRVRTEFISNAAHELQTPITPMVLQLHILERALQADNAAAAHSAFTVVDRNLTRLRKHVDLLLDASRIQSDRFGLSVRPVDLAEIGRHAYDARRDAARDAGLTLHFEAPQAVWVEGDEARLVEVATQLLGNAVKFTPRGGTVTLRVRAGDDARLEVLDTGLGLDSGQQARLFQPFVQVHDTSSGPVEGSGLGLFIAQGIATAHGGRIEVESKGHGRGSTFSLLLPLVQAPEGSPERTDPQGS